MKAIVIDEYGGPEVLRYTDHEDPKMGTEGILIRVKAAGVNPVDWAVREGKLADRMVTHFPLILGRDVAGIVEKVGPNATRYSPSDEVIGYARLDWLEYGTYAELVAAPIRTIGRKPAALSWAQAGGLPLAGLTAYQTLHDALAIAPGETILIHAAAGGVGSMGVQIAVARGARVLGTASPRNHDYLRGLGAEPVAYGDGLEERVRALAPDGLDAIADFHGGPDLKVFPRLLKIPTRIASTIDPQVFHMGGKMVQMQPRPHDLAALATLAGEGKLTVNVDRTFPLAAAAEAHRHAQERHTRGKVVLTIDS